ncbi:DUF2335 domain-containing protein [Escherichia coli]
MQVTHTRSGPLPDADELAKYERISPGFAREIMDMAKAEQKHRHEYYKAGQRGANLARSTRTDLCDDFCLCFRRNCLQDDSARGLWLGYRASWC